MKSFEIFRFLPVLLVLTLLVGIALTEKRDRTRALWAAGLFALYWSTVLVASLLNVWLTFWIGTGMSAGSGGSRFPLWFLVMNSIIPVVIAGSSVFLFPLFEDRLSMRAFRLLFYILLPLVVVARFSYARWTHDTFYWVDTAPFYAALWWLRVKGAFVATT